MLYTTLQSRSNQPSARSSTMSQPQSQPQPISSSSSCSPFSNPLAIIGSGLSGLTLSIALSTHSIPHHIYESASAFSEIGAGIALGPNASRALDMIDQRITAGVEKFITFNEGIEVVEERRRAFAFCRGGMRDGLVVFFFSLAYFWVSQLRRWMVWSERLHVYGRE